MTTPLTPTGMPWCVTQSMASSASRRSSDKRRTACTPGSTAVPFPVMILNPSVSITPSGAPRWRSPEMISASFGSATRHMALNTTTMSTTAATATYTINIEIPPEPALHGGDGHSAGWEVLDDDDAGAGADGRVGVGRVGMERLAPA